MYEEYDDQEEAYDAGYDSGQSDSGHGWGGWIIGLVIGLVVYGLFFSKPKYEGMTAEEWFNEYDYAVACIQNMQSTSQDYSRYSDYDDLIDLLDSVYYKGNSCI